jgi:uncharacterized protein YndB with AHSA1/START domain
MIDYKGEVTINVPAETVFRALTDHQKWSMWTDMADTTVVSGTGFNQVGSQIESVMGEGPLKQKMKFEVSALEPNRRLAFKTISKGSMQWDGEFNLEAQGPSVTRLLTTGQIRLGGAAKLMEGVMSGEIKKGEQKEIEKLKELLESGKM